MKDDKLGWISLHRKIQNNFLWKDGRVFSKAEAWIDILMEVQHSPDQTKTMIKNTIITCDRGQSIKSIQTWADRWTWTRSAVQRYLQLLKREGMLTTENLTKTIRLSVCNYSTYQMERIKGELKVNRTRTEGELNPDTDNNDNNETNENKGNNENNETSGSSFPSTDRISLGSDGIKFYDLACKLFGCAKKADKTTLQRIAEQLSKSLDEKVFDKAWRVAQECVKTGDKPIALFISRMKDDFDYRSLK